VSRMCTRSRSTAAFAAGSRTSRVRSFTGGTR
jgi:hypothetical protein